MTIGEEVTNLRSLLKSSRSMGSVGLVPPPTGWTSGTALNPYAVAVAGMTIVGAFFVLDT